MDRYLVHVELQGYANYEVSASNPDEAVEYVKGLIEELNGTRRETLEVSDCINVEPIRFGLDG